MNHSRAQFLFYLFNRTSFSFIAYLLVSVAIPVLLFGFALDVKESIDKLINSEEIANLIGRITVVGAVIFALRTLIFYISEIVFYPNLSSLARRRILDTVLTSSNNYFDSVDVGDTSRRIWESGRYLNELLGQLLTVLLPCSVTIVISIVYISRIDILASALCFVWMVLIFSLSFFAARKLRAYTLLSVNHSNDINSEISDLLYNRHTYRDNVHSPDEKWSLNLLFDRFVSSVKNSAIKNLFVRFAINIVNIALVCAYVLWTYLLYETGDATVADILFVGGLMIRLSVMYNQISNASVSTYRAWNVFSNSIEMLDNAGKDSHLFKDRIYLNHSSELDAKTLIKVKNVYVYGNGSYDNSITWEDIEIKRGQKYIILGKSGCGKSTLINLLTGKIDSYEGNIEIFSSDIKKIHRSAIQEVYSICRQEGKLLRGSIGRNITYSDHYDETLLEKALDISGLREQISPKTVEIMEYDSANLSGGQVQRVKIAAALARTAYVYILDEPTSALDEEGGREIIENIITNIEDSVIVISHNKELVGLFDHSILHDSEMSMKKVQGN